MVTTFIVDDSTAVRERLANLLSDIPEVHIVGQAQDGTTAVSEIRATAPDVVILDINLPGENGIEVLRTIKGISPAPMVLMLTNYAHPLYWKKCMNEGADGFFDKSTEFHKTLDVFRSLVDRRKEAVH